MRPARSTRAPAAPFLDGAADTEAALSRVRRAIEGAGLWDELGTGWLVLDCELLPWSAKAMDLIQRQYAAVGSAAQAGLTASIATLEQAAARGLDVADMTAAQRGASSTSIATSTPTAATSGR